MTFITHLFVRYRKQIAVLGLFVVLGVAHYYYNIKPLTYSLLRVGIIDGDRLKKDAQPFTAVANLMEKEFAKAREEYLPFESEIRKLYDELKEEKNTRKAKAKQLNFDKKQASIEKIIATKQERLARLDAYYINLLQQKVFDIVEKLAKKHDIKVIFNRTVDDKLVVFHADKSMDLTDEVIHNLNTELEKIPPLP